VGRRDTGKRVARRVRRATPQERERGLRSVDRDAPGERGDVTALYHDLRQPLAVIGALVSAAAAQQGVPDVVLKCLDRIADEATGALALCRHELEERHDESVVPVDLLSAEVVEGIARLTTCRLSLTATHCALRTDPVGLRRVLVNLIDNAVRAAGSDGQVAVTVEVEPARFRVVVDDSGPGFGSGPSGSSGLGLMVVERFVRRHGGLLEIGRSSLGGSAVGFVIPLAAPAVIEADAAPTASCTHLWGDGGRSAVPGS
jgi:signal transduction histidine kinase